MTFHSHDARRVVELFADIFANALEPASAAADCGPWFVTELYTRQIGRQRCALGLLAILLGLFLIGTQCVELNFNRSNIGIQRFIEQACLCSIELLGVTAKAPTLVESQLLSELIDLGLPLCQDSCPLNPI